MVKSFLLGIFFLFVSIIKAQSFVATVDNFNFSNEAIDVYMRKYVSALYGRSTVNFFLPVTILNLKMCVEKKKIDLKHIHGC